MPVNARRLIRKMRGGAQAHLLECDDGRFYITKFVNNPQHRRILVNEWISSVFLRFLEISAPDTAVVNVSKPFLDENTDVYLQLGSRRLDVEAGWHFGSCHPGDPAKMTVYDFVPDTLLDKVVNLDEFLGVLVFDKWLGNADARQAIFFRAQLKPYRRKDSEHPLQLGFVASMMDHGYVFDGPHWSFTDSPLQGLYFRPKVYEKVRSWDDFEPWLSRVIHFPEEVIDQAYKQIPPQWLAGEEDELERLLTKVLSRRKRVPELVRGSQHGRINPFPNWR